MTTDTVDPSFARRHRLLVALGVLMLVAIIVFMRLSRNYLAEQPIVAPWKSYIERLANASPAARSELQSYLAASGRDSVASQDFQRLCETMVRQAEAQGVQVAQILREDLPVCKRGAYRLQK